MTTVEKLRERTETIPYDGCWIWLGATVRGYGSVGFEGKTRRAHRVMYEVAYNVPIEGKVVMHTCDNPGCVNPEHLRLGTQKENIHDCLRKGRFCKGCAPPIRSKLSPRRCSRNQKKLSKLQRIGAAIWSAQAHDIRYTASENMGRAS